MSECDISQCSTPNADKLSNEICDVDDPILNSIGKMNLEFSMMF